MLKITTSQEAPESIRVRLCGQLTGEYVGELEKVLFDGTPPTAKIALDLSNVTFVDREAMEFLCGASSRNVSMENIPSYVMRWIEQEGRCGARKETPNE